MDAWPLSPHLATTVPAATRRVPGCGSGRRSFSFRVRLAPPRPAPARPGRRLVGGANTGAVLGLGSWIGCGRGSDREQVVGGARVGRGQGEDLAGFKEVETLGAGAVSPRNRWPGPVCPPSEEIESGFVSLQALKEARARCRKTQRLGLDLLQQGSAPSPAPLSKPDQMGCPR